jgi:hypothetical protein
VARAGRRVADDGGPAGGGVGVVAGGCRWWWREGEGTGGLVPGLAPAACACPSKSRRRCRAGGAEPQRRPAAAAPERPPRRGAPPALAAAAHLSSTRWLTLLYCSASCMKERKMGTGSQAMTLEDGQGRAGGGQGRGWAGLQKRPEDGGGAVTAALESLRHQQLCSAQGTSKPTPPRPEPTPHPAARTHLQPSTAA